MPKTLWHQRQHYTMHWCTMWSLTMACAHEKHTRLCIVAMREATSCLAVHWLRILSAGTEASSQAATQASLAAADVTPKGRPRTLSLLETAVRNRSRTPAEIRSHKAGPSPLSQGQANAFSQRVSLYSKHLVCIAEKHVAQNNSRHLEYLVSGAEL